MSEVPFTDLLGDLHKLIQAGRQRAAVAVNSELVLLYWQVGTRIRTDLLDEERAPYGEQIVSTVSAQLVPDYGRGFSRRNPYRMIQFAEAWPDAEIVSTLSARLGWSDVIELLVVKEPLARNFYAELGLDHRFDQAWRSIDSNRPSAAARSRWPPMVARAWLSSLFVSPQGSTPCRGETTVS